MGSSSSQWVMGSRRWAMGDGRWAMGNGRWARGDGRWAMDGTQLLEGSGVVLCTHVPLHTTGQARSCPQGTRGGPQRWSPVVFGELPCLSSKCTMQHNPFRGFSGSGWRSVCTYLCNSQPRKRVFGDLLCLSSNCTMQHNPSGFRVALCLHIPVHLTTQKACFWRPTMLVFKVHNAPQCLGGSGWRSVCTYLCNSQPRKRVITVPIGPSFRLAVHGGNNTS